MASGYPNRRWLLTPYLNPATIAQKRFNSAHRRTRVLVEQAFGVMKRRFHILHAENRLEISKAPKVVVCCAALHAIDCKLNLEEDVENIEPNEDEEIYDGDLNVGTAFRDHFAAVNFG